MIELKTLKDLKKEDGFVELEKDNLWLVPLHILKEEAIKWIKELRRIREQLSEDNRFEIGWNEGRQQFIEEFFNISEEDLK